MGHRTSHSERALTYHQRVPTPAEPMRLAAGFEPATRDDWADLAGLSLRGRTLESLTTVTDDDIRIEPLYGDDGLVDRAGLPGASPHTRGSAVAGNTEAGWDVRALVLDAGTAAANATVLDELERGSTSVLVDRAAIGIGSAADLAAVLDGVFLEMAPVALVPGPDAATAAGWLVELWEQLGTPVADRSGALGVDPIGVAARHGGDPDLSTLAPAVASVADAPGVHAITVDATVWADAGASEAWELACSLATGVAYLRALEDDGISIDDALGALTFTYSADADQFRTVARFRAARRLWDRVAGSCGSDVRAQHQTAVTSDAMLARRDPWVNLMRGAVAAFSAGIGGASSVTVRPFDSAIGRPDEFGRRTARNTQLLLTEESGLARVVDPAGGSWFVEELTERLAGAAWERFRWIEADGGMLAALSSGRIADEVGATRTARAARLATRTDGLTGVSEFPDLDESGLDRLPGPAPAGGGPFPLHRLAEPFEALRDAGEAADPVVRLVSLGPLAEHSERTTFAANLLAVAGIRTTVEAGSPVAVICGTDDRCAAEAVDVARELRVDGVAHVLLVGRPGDRESDWRDAGVDEFVHARSDVLDVLGRMLDVLGVAR